MATVWLLRGDCEAGTLPGVCLVCGQAAPARVEMDFRGTLVWIDPFLALSAPRVKVRVPTCDEHRRHWRDRFRRTFWTLALGSLLSAPCAAFLLLVDLPEKEDPRLLPWLVLCPLALGVIGVWVTMTLIVHSATGVRAVEVREQGIHLTHVSQSYVETDEHQKRAGRGLRTPDETRFHG
jgi:hypothetical protein